eukprot:Skav234923  [mRNA]  locus=scaffold840:956698:961575:+ [translate_table: standard]
MDFDLPHVGFLGFWPWGEALNPGPGCGAQHVVSVGFTNPSGLRGKEAQALSLGQGIWNFAETQLSHVTQRSSWQSFRSLAVASGRDLRVHMGAPVATRANSQWAGTWSGVCAISDHPSKELSLAYGGERSCGRLLTTQHFVNGLPLLISNVYGYPRGPTWPRAKQLTTELLSVLTQEIVLGSTGPRLIGGDFNWEEADLEPFALWQRFGRRSAQDLAWELWGVEKQKTCKAATTPDIVWLSPEAQALLHEVLVHDVFMEHAVVQVSLRVPSGPSVVLAWPRPSTIPWESVDSAWTSAPAPHWTNVGSVDDRWAEWGASFEKALDGHVSGQPQKSLDLNQRGRCQSSQPRWRPSVVTTLKPSRPSEVSLRNDLAGTAVKSWFRQLRRLQSYVHAIVAGKQTPEALCYRLELWTSIRGARGFRHSFAHWWTHLRTVRPPDCPFHLPSGPPSVSVAQAIFCCFRQCFERFEQWRLRQRSALLRARYDHSLAALYQDLKPVQRNCLDFVIESVDHSVLAVDQDSSQVHLASMVTDSVGSTWTWDGDPIQVSLVNECTLQVTDLSPDMDHGHILTQRMAITETQGLHERLLSYWKDLWCSYTAVPEEVWQRITGFFTAYMPRLDFDLSPISLPQWRAALRRFGPRAARGVDGISHRDLLALPDAWTSRLLDLLNQVENGGDWPQCVLYGVVNLLAKDQFPSSIDRYRPVVVFSVIYRTWSSLRSKQLIACLARFLDCDTYGFVPGREAQQLWLMLHAEIELALQSRQSLCGLSTDLVRAFNHVPRQHTFRLSEHLGVPSCVLQPWKSFLSTCTRAFMVHGCLSSATKSSRGLPEGDALSVYAMLQLDFAYHVYMRSFAPAVRVFSFVDNLSLVAHRVGDLVQGLACLQQFLTLWGLDLDSKKSYCWALTTQQRRQLTQLPFVAVTQAKELGGALSFSRRPSTGVFKQRAVDLAPRWDRLKRSGAPFFQKLLSLSTVFWPSALHGSHGSTQSATLMRDLRTAATQSLGVNKAGSNGLLRLSLSGWPTADPGFWRLRTLTFSFRRLAVKEPMIVAEWKSFMDIFDGSLFGGPFTQMLQVFNQIGWFLEPPFVVDHDGLQHHLNDKAVDELLLDGWLQYVAGEVKHRKLMDDLEGLAPEIAIPDKSKLNGLELALQGSLQSGAFLSSSSQAKFDMTKDGWCPHCDQPDDQLHWVECPLKAHLRPSSMEELLRGSSKALRAHLLPSRSVWTVPWRTAKMNIVDESTVFHSVPSGDLQHVFTDGSATKGPFAMAAWGSINATTGAVVTVGHLPGITQNSARAELFAIVSALEWQVHFRVHMHLWCDCKYIVDRLQKVIRHGVAGPLSHMDLWRRIGALLEQLPSDSLVVHWIPSHLDEASTENAYEDWVRRHNNAVDRLVGEFNLNRPGDFLEMHKQAIHHHELVSQQFLALRTFYGKVAAENTATDESELPTSSGSGENSFVQGHFPTLISHFPSREMDVQFLAGPIGDQFPMDFLGQLFHWLLFHDQPDGLVYKLTFIELTFLLSSEPGFRFPFANPRTGHLELSDLGSRYERPTLAYLLRFVRNGVRRVCSLSDLSDVLFTGSSHTHLGIIMPVDGIHIRLDRHVADQAKAMVCSFTCSRPLRKACDLARPF